MSEKIKVSVIVPVFNEQQYIEETAAYINNQTLQEIEIIYVDDGSTDRTLELLEKIKKEDKRVILLHQKNGYAGTARNAGLKIARGDYVAFWDGDDIFHEDALEKMYLRSVADHADICICKANHYDEETGKIQRATTYLKPDLLPEKSPFGHEQIDSYLFNFSTNVPWNKLYRREFLMENHLTYQEIPQANDNYFAMKAYFYAKVFTVVEEALIDYRINYGSSLTGNASGTPLCVYEAYKKTYDELKEESEFENVRQSFFNKTLRGFLYFLNKQTDIEAYKILYNALKENVIKGWEFPSEPEYYYSTKDYDRLCRIRKLEAQQYLITEFRNFYKENAALKDKKNRQKERIEKQKEKITAQKEKILRKNEKIERLKEKNLKQKEQIEVLQRRIREMKESTTYKVGQIITYIPRKIKGILGGRTK